MGGWGEGGQYGPAEPVAAVIDEVLGPRLVGRAVAAPQKVNDEHYSFSRDFGQKGTYIEAISAIDIALWDLWGQKLGQPVCELLGGSVRGEITAYATGCYYPNTFHDTEALMAELEEEAEVYASAGFSALKIKVGLLSVRADAERLALVRNAIGPGIKILVDANHAYNTQTAIRMARELEKHGVLWFEEPVVPEDRGGYRRVRDATDVPIAGGKAEFTRYGFRDLFLGKCVDIAQPDLCCCGGFSEWLKIQALASSFGVQMVPHVWGSGIRSGHGTARAGNDPAVAPYRQPAPFAERAGDRYDRKHNPLRDDLLVENFTLTGGKLAVPEGPGLGVKVNEGVLYRYAKN